MDYLLQAFDPTRDDTRASHIRKCQQVCREAQNGASSSSGWGGPGGQAFEMLRDVARFMRMEVAVRIVEDELLNLGYDEQGDYHYSDDLFEGEYRLTAQAAGGYWSITVKHNPDLHTKHELMVALSKLLDGYSGNSWEWEDGFTVAGPVRVI